MEMKKTILNIFMILYLVFFSLPIVFIWYSPMWQFTSYDYNPFATILRLLAILFSPYAFLAMGIVCYWKGLRFQTYIVSTLFIWSVVTQIVLVLYSQMLMFPPYEQHIL